MTYLITNYYNTIFYRYNLIYYRDFIEIKYNRYELASDIIVNDLDNNYKSNNKKLIRFIIKNKHTNCFLVKKILRYAYKHNCPWNNACEYISKNNNLKCFKYAYEHGGQLTTTTCVYAVINNNFKALKYMYKPDHYLNRWMCEYAAQHNYLECLKYINNHHCPFSDSAWKDPTERIDKTELLKINGLNDETKQYIEENM